MHFKNNLAKIILAWYDNNKRNLPWRVSKYSRKKIYYRILSEFMLQQTQVKTVLPYFYKFIKKYPTLKSLSKAKEKDVIKLWEGLGYYRRAKNLLLTTKIISKKKNDFPKNFEDLKELPGIGDYTANALLAFIYNKPRIAFDGNVKRVFSRLLNKHEENINFNELVEKNKNNFFKSKRNSDFAEALIEFGALICKSKNPECLNCPLNKNCKYYKSSKKINLKRNNKLNYEKDYDIFCHINNKKQIALTKSNQLGFLKDFNLPMIKESKSQKENKNWRFLKNYKNTISNLKL
ncbi:MAG: A/G-specific adenine glycosylase, partial [Candidatus Pelagibacter sp. TMED165]